jgi:HNH endonuclease
MLSPQDVLSYREMCDLYGISLQRGMNFRIRGDESLILMSVRPGAPYEDRVEQAGRIVIYEGHDASRYRSGPDPKFVDQPEFQPNGRPTQNGLFIKAVRQYKSGEAQAERVRIFEKIRDGIWVYNGLFELIDGWQETNERRQVFKFKLQLLEEILLEPTTPTIRVDFEHDRVIPSAVKVEVWKRDKGRCVECGSKDNLHFDHIIPYSQGGSSKDAANIQILCSRHNLQKRDNIQ